MLVRWWPDVLMVSVLLLLVPVDNWVCSFARVVRVTYVRFSRNAQPVLSVRPSVHCLQCLGTYA